MNNQIAQINLFEAGRLGHIWEPGFGLDPAGTLNDYISATVGLLTGIASLWFIYLFITGALEYMNAGSDKQAIESSRQRITNALIGLLLVVAAIFLIGIVGNIFGLRSILNPGTLIESGQVGI